MRYGANLHTVPSGMPVARAVLALMPMPSGYPGWYTTYWPGPFQPARVILLPFLHCLSAALKSIR